MYPGFFKEIVALDKKRDVGLTVKPVEGFVFTKGETVLPALVDEFPALVRDFPVVFTNHEIPVMVAVLGHRANRFLEEDGAWRKDRYIPLAVRVYPFAGIDDDKGEPVFCIDRTYEGLGEKGGEKIFADKEGALTDFGRNAAGFANFYLQSLKKTRVFCEKLKALDLFMPAEITVTANGERYQFAGLNQINMAKVAALDPEQISDLVKTGEMFWIYLHQLSFGNFSRIV